MQPGSLLHESLDHVVIIAKTNLVLIEWCLLANDGLRRLLLILDVVHEVLGSLRKRCVTLVHSRLVG